MKYYICLRCIAACSCIACFGGSLLQMIVVVVFLGSAMLRIVAKLELIV